MTIYANEIHDEERAFYGIKEEDKYIIERKENYDDICK